MVRKDREERKRPLPVPDAFSYYTCTSVSLTTSNVLVTCQGRIQDFSQEGVHPDSSPAVSLSVSLQWREVCDEKEESRGESLPPFSLPITPCSRRARYTKRTGDESGVHPSGTIIFMPFNINFSTLSHVLLQHQ